MKIRNIPDHAPSYLPDSYDFKLVWSDEFDGDEIDPGNGITAFA